MCESTVFLLDGEERTMIMPEAARVLITEEGVVCVDTLGERRVVEGAELHEANLIKHEILLRRRRN
ncbi:MAG: CooT family nickel-binding protein [Methanobacteriota archaeon]|nr:MAG: CooT family nickel-binding protein [Euryarchaeota archaeon]